MTLDDVMKLEGRELDAAVGERIEWVATMWNYSPVDGSRLMHPCPEPTPEFSVLWEDAMKVREWAKAGEPSRARMWIEAVSQCETARNRPTSYISFGSDVLLHAEPIDYARAALLVSP